MKYSEQIKTIGSVLLVLTLAAVVFVVLAAIVESVDGARAGANELSNRTSTVRCVINDSVMEFEAVGAVFISAQGTWFRLRNSKIVEFSPIVPCVRF